MTMKLDVNDLKNFLQNVTQNSKRSILILAHSMWAPKKDAAFVAH